MKFKSIIEHFSTVFNPFLLCRSHCAPQFPKETGHSTCVQTQGASYCLPSIGSHLPSIWEIHQTLLSYPPKPTLPPFVPKWRYPRHADSLRGVPAYGCGNGSYRFRSVMLIKGSTSERSPLAMSEGPALSTTTWCGWRECWTGSVTWVTAWWRPTSRR